MKQILSIFFFLCVTSPLFLFAQQKDTGFSTEGWWKPAGPAFSPDIHADRTVTFRLKAPEITRVELKLGEWEVETYPMHKDGEGVWSVTVGPIPPGIYQYTFEVQGIPVIDMTNPVVKAGTSVYGSVLEIRGEKLLFDQLQEVPKGDIHILSYTSSSLKRPRKMYVYVPDSYYTNPDRTFPVLYLRHGGGDRESSWTEDGRAGIILDNLIAARKAEPMLVVMTHGLTDGSWSGGSTVEGMRDLEAELLEDVLPLIEQRYRVRKERSSRAIAGLSMGGGQAYVMGLRNLHLFSSIGQFSAGILSDGAFDHETYLPGVITNPEKVNRQLDLLWISCGTKDPRYKGHRMFVEELGAKGIHYEFHESEAGHEWPFWRRQLHDFVQRLFK